MMGFKISENIKSWSITKDNVSWYCIYCRKVLKKSLIEFFTFVLVAKQY